MRWINVSLFLLFFFFSSVIQASVPAERGWWFFGFSPEASVAEPMPIHSFSTHKHSLEKKETRCQTQKTWDASCGFMPPTTYAFEQQEYHGLIQSFAMHPNDLSRVYQFQRFTHWAIQQAMTGAYAWQFNVAQHPELDSTVYSPYSQFGNQFISHLNDAREKTFFTLLSHTSFLVYFSRCDCAMCHREASIIQRLAKKTGLPVWDASLDNHLLPGFTKGLVAPATLSAARALKIAITPTVFLYLKPSDKKQGAKWIRLGTGLVSVATLKTRLIHFVEAYRHAMLSGASQASSPPDFRAVRPDLLETEQLKPLINGETR